MSADNREAHIQTHTHLMVTWMRKPDLAAKLGIQNAAAIQADVMAHISERMKYWQSGGLNHDNRRSSSRGSRRRLHSRL